jgi:SPP1 family predicted phage head-tail adaptor
MKAGTLDRSIKIQQNAGSTYTDAGDPVALWQNVHTGDFLAARMVPNRGAERFQNQQIVGQSVLTFYIRWRDDVNTKCRLVYDGKNYDIKDVREIGRREGLELDVTVRSDG